MGYYTRFDLEVVGEAEHWVTGKTKDGQTVQVNVGVDIESIKQEIGEISGYGECFSDELKWYDHEKDMRCLSMKYPKLLFKLSGNGEESPDIWVKYYQNGKSQHCPGRIVFDDFDPKKLT